MQRERERDDGVERKTKRVTVCVDGKCDERKMKRGESELRQEQEEEELRGK